MRKFIVPVMFAFGILVGALLTGSVGANPGTDAARAGLAEAAKRLAQLPPDPAGHLKRSIMSTQQAAIELNEYAKNAK